MRNQDRGQAGFAALAAVFLWLCALAGSASAQSVAASAHDPIRFGEVPDFALTTEQGATLTRADLLGAPWIATLFFTSCSGPCPRLSADIRRLLHDQLAGSPVRIVSFSVDPDTDTVEALADYSATFTADPERWTFLTGAEEEVHRFVREGLKLPVDKPARDESEVGRLVERLQVTHATRLVVVDAAGQIAGYYECGGEEGRTEAALEESFRSVLARARALARPRSARLPAINATLNAIAAVLLIAGLVAIKSGRRELHGNLMRAAFLASAAFLACYLYYHFVVLPVSGGPTKYNATGWRKTAYLVLLASHVLLAIVNLPMVLRTLWHAHKEDWERHRRLARKTYPIWLYVSVTGVVVYLVLYHWNPAA